MRTKITLFTLLLSTTFSVAVIAQNKPAVKSKNGVKETSAKEAVVKEVTLMTADETVQDFIKKIKAEEIPTNKKKLLVELLEKVNKESNVYSNIVTKDWEKIYQSSKGDQLDPKLVKAKDVNQAVLDSWISYKIAFKANSDLFVEKKEDRYSCSNISEQITNDYSPISAQKTKPELDAETKKAIESSIEIAEELCKYAQDIQ